MVREILDIEYTPGDCSRHALVKETCASIHSHHRSYDVNKEAARACTRYTDGHNAAWNLLYSHPKASHARHAGNTHLHGACQYGQGCGIYDKKVEDLLAHPLGPCGH